jgi:hypothetical protein
MGIKVKPNEREDIMIRNLKALGLVLSAVFAFSAMAASSASAVDTFTVEGGGSVNVSGVSHNNVFKITGPEASVVCTTSTFSGTATNGSNSLTITPTYIGRPEETPHGTKCNALGSAATVNMNTCDYDLTGSTTGSDSGTDATTSITCSGSNEIIITTDFGLILRIPAQTPTSGGVTYTNEGSKVKVTATATGITYTCETAFLCAISNLSMAGNSGDYNGSVILAGAGGKRIEWSAS